MADFTDAQDRKWSVSIDVPTIKKLKQYDLDVLGMFDEGFKGFEQLVGDPVRLVDTLWVVCEDEASGRGIDEVAFAKAMVGDAISRAVNALVEGVCDFFPDPKRRATIREVFRKATEVEATLLEGAHAQIEALSVTELAEAMLTEFTEKSGDSPGSSE